MPKRKRDGSVESINSSVEGDEPHANPSKPIRKSKTVHDKLHHGTLVLQRALKLARGFERQKFSRRIKSAAAEKDEAKLARLEEEKTALQSLDLQLAARKCLRRHIEKEKALREAVDIKTEFEEVDGAKQLGDQTAVVNVESRLYGSNPVKESLPSVLGSLRGVLGLGSSNGITARKTQKATTDREDVEHSNESDSILDEHDNRPTRDSVISASNAPKPPKSAPERPAEATFFPSLTMGGYFSGSESDDGHPYDDALPQLTERKNRRGQRARQAIWEKKYGVKAKHLQEEKSAARGHKGKGDGRDAGWDMKRGAQDGGAVKRKPGAKPWLANRYKKGDASASGGNATELKPRKFGTGAKDEDKPLHPSWEAARKAKETKAIPAFSGTKMRFD